MLWDIAKFILFFALLIYGVVLIALYFFQDRLIFPAPKLALENFHPHKLEKIHIPTSDGEKLFALYHPAKKGQATIILFHGNGDAAILQAHRAEKLVSAGFGVLALEYRGYPGSTGAPSEEGLFEDARAGYDFIRRENAHPIGLYGQSLGTGVAIKLASERAVYALVLEAPFDSMMAVAGRHYPFVPMGLLLRHKFRSDIFVKDVTAPMLIIHGREDKIIPINHGRALLKQAPKGTEFMEIKGASHNDLAWFNSEGLAIEFFRKVLR